MPPRTPLEAPPPASILVWLNGALGDTILGFPALMALRAWAPAASFTVVGRPRYLELGQRCGLVDAIEDADGPLALQLFAGGESRLPFDMAIIWSSAFARLRNVLEANGIRRVVATAPRGPGSLHQARYLLDSLAQLGIKRRRLAVPIVGDAVRRRTCVTEVPASAVVLHPGAGAPWKQWPVAQYLALAAGLRNAGIPVHWSFGPADADLRAALAPEITRAGDRVHVGLPLPALGEIFASSALVVSGDTGVAHLAALYGARQLTLFGPTDPRRWRPLSPFGAIMAAPDRCGGRWAPAESSWTSSREVVIRRCASPTNAGCCCLASLSGERVLARCLSMWHDRPHSAR